MRFVVTGVWTRQRALQIAADMNAQARSVPGAHPDRVYVVERVRFLPKVVKYTKGLAEARNERGAS